MAATPEKRIDDPGSAQTIAGLLWVFYLASLAWLLAFPRPYAVAVLVNASLPWFALALCWKFGRLFAIDGFGRNTGRADLAGLVVGPGMVVSVRALRDVDLLSPTDPVLAAVICALLMAATVAWVSPSLRKKAGRFALVWLLLVPYFFGLLPIADTLLDRAEPLRLRATVVGERQKTGKWPAQYVTLGSSGQAWMNDELRVRLGVYRQIRVGQEVCVRQHPGALGWAWYSVDVKSQCF